jgi:hypothetical protein
MTEETGFTDDVPDADVTPETAAPELEVTPDVPPAIDMDAIHAATQAHSDAVSAAHETLKQRVGNAYSIFASELDNAMRAWQNAVSEIKSHSGLIGETAEVIRDAGTDASRAV